MKAGRKLFRVYVLGNLLIEQDSLPLKLLPKLRKKFSNIEFVELDPTENIPEEERLVIIDSVVGIDGVGILSLKDLGKIELSPRYSLHDFDLGLSLKLMKNLGKVEDVKIIGVPASGDEKKVFDEIRKIISSLISENA